jgi:hypothetical protein
MQFSDLMDLPFDPRSDLIELDAVISALPNTPEAVARQVFVDHGRKEEFQAAYGCLDISAIEWKQVKRPAVEICSASVLPLFRRWFEGVGHRPERFEAEGWACIDSRPAVVAHWAEHSTWITPPVLIYGELEGGTGLRLIEGHTRVGLLAGLIKRQVLSGNSSHLIWLGIQQSGLPA